MGEEVSGRAPFPRPGYVGDAVLPTVRNNRLENLVPQHVAEEEDKANVLGKRSRRALTGVVPMKHSLQPVSFQVLPYPFLYKGFLAPYHSDGDERQVFRWFNNHLVTSLASSEFWCLSG